MMKNFVYIDQLYKSYHTTQALNNIHLEVNKGELFGIIGADGAGKSTLFRILATLINPDKGLATINNYDVVKEFKKIRSMIGYMPGKFSLYQDLSIEENIHFFASIFGTSLQENKDFIYPIYRQIEPFKKRLAGRLSGGMKQKLALCCALIHKPKLLLLDEPTTGVDPTSRQEFWGILKELKDFNITTIVSTPYMDEAILCDRVALMKNGAFLTTDTPQNIILAFPYLLLAIKSKDMGQLLIQLRTLKGIISCFAFGNELHLTLPLASEITNTLAPLIKKWGYQKVEIAAITPTIEDCFLAYNQSL